MNYKITSQDVLTGLDGQYPADDVNGWIDVADTADACMSSRGVPEPVGVRLKILFVRHILTVGSGSGSGTVTSQSSASGASRSFASWQPGQTGFGDSLKTLDRWGCVWNLLRSGTPAVALKSVG